jgi:tungstate transport system substrate-binding protein
VKRFRLSAAVFSLLIIAAAAALAAPPKAGLLRLATTTSTADSGLLGYILPDFEKRFTCSVDVVAVGTGQSLELGRRGDADVVLVHSRPGEDKFVADGFARERFDVMYNDFIVVGPKADPARVRGMSLAKEAFQAVMEAGQPFASRGDKSGTHVKELAVWASLGVTPDAGMKWYNSLGQGMGEVLLFAQNQQAYTLADRGTYLAMMDKLPDLDILVGGRNLAENQDKILLNPYGVLAVSPDKYPQTNFELAMKFVAWICSAETQKRIAGFGVDRFGQPLFYADSAEYRAAKK